MPNLYVKLGIEEIILLSDLQQCIRFWNIYQTNKLVQASLRLTHSLQTDRPISRVGGEEEAKCLLQ